MLLQCSLLLLILVTFLSFLYSGTAGKFQAHSEGVRMPAVLEDAAVPYHAAKSPCACRRTQIH